MWWPENVWNHNSGAKRSGRFRATAPFTPIQIFQLGSAGAPGEIGTRCGTKRGLEGFPGFRNQKDRTAGGLEHKQSVKFVPKIKMRQKDAETAMSAFDFRLPCEVEVEISASVSSSMRIHTSRAEFLETRWRNFEFRAEGGRFFTCRGKHLADTWPNAAEKCIRESGLGCVSVRYWAIRIFRYSVCTYAFWSLLPIVLLPPLESSRQPLCKQIKCSACLLFCPAPNDEDQQGHLGK